jgi:hypothetical protein
MPMFYWCLCLFTIIPILPWSGQYKKHCGLTYQSFAIAWKEYCPYSIDCKRFYWFIFAYLHIDVFFTNVQWVLGVCGHFSLQVHILIICLGYKYLIINEIWHQIKVIRTIDHPIGIHTYKFYIFCHIYSCTALLWAVQEALWFKI